MANTEETLREKLDMLVKDNARTLSGVWSFNDKLEHPATESYYQLFLSELAKKDAEIVKELTQLKDEITQVIYRYTPMKSATAKAATRE